MLASQCSIPSGLSLEISLSLFHATVSTSMLSHTHQQPLRKGIFYFLLCTGPIILAVNIMPLAVCGLDSVHRSALRLGKEERKEQ